MCIRDRNRQDYTDSTDHFGLIAQDVEKIFPNIVKKDQKGYLSINYIELIPILINAMQEQNSRIKQLEDTLKALKQ